MTTDPLVQQLAELAPSSLIWVIQQALEEHPDAQRLDRSVLTFQIEDTVIALDEVIVNEEG